MSETALAAPSPAPPRYGLALAALELLLACAAYAAAAVGICPGSGAGLSCATLIRPSLASIGPLPIAGIGVVGAALTLLLAGLALDPERLKASPWLARTAVGVPALGAGFVLGLQALPLAAGVGLCPLCLAVAASALAAAVAIGAGVARALPGERGVAIVGGVAVAVSLVLTVPGAVLHGRALAVADGEARAQLEGLEQRQGRGPLLLLVERAGCPYCEALRLDVLGRGAVAQRLHDGGWRLERVDEHDARAEEHAGGHGAPVLIAFDAAGKRRGRLRGYRRPRAVEAWLSGLPE